ncbi:MAG: hypothetical protein JNM80_11040 [Phycisphaerae bacterium]|nr:hypothetical protein [Phycisphaerae bacterium]
MTPTGHIAAPRAARRRATRRPSARAALLFEVILALAIFVGAGLAILSSIDGALTAQSRARLAARAADLARTAIARIEAGIDTPQTLHGPVRHRSLDPDADDAQPADDGWELDIDTTPSSFSGLTHVTVTAKRLTPSGVEEAAFTLHQLVRLRAVESDSPGAEDEIARRAREAAPRTSPPPRTPPPGARP